MTNTVLTMTTIVSTMTTTVSTMTYTVLFDASSGKQASAMASQRLFQSLGVTLMFALAYTDSLSLAAAVLLAVLLLSTAALAWEHFRVASLDTGRYRYTLG